MFIGTDEKTNAAELREKIKVICHTVHSPNQIICSCHQKKKKNPTSSKWKHNGENLWKK